MSNFCKFDPERGLVFDFGSIPMETALQSIFYQPKVLRKEIKKLLISVGIDKVTARDQAQAAMFQIQEQASRHLIHALDTQPLVFLSGGYSNTIH